MEVESFRAEYPSIQKGTYTKLVSKKQKTGYKVRIRRYRLGPNEEVHLRLD
jgi:hypothetical protein